MQYLPSSLASTTDQLTVVKVVAAAHSPSPVAPDSSAMVNHWCFYLQTSSRQSVRFDMTPSGNSGVKDKSGMAGVLMVQKLDYLLSNQVVKSYDLTLKESITVKDFADVIQGEGYDKYDFNSSGIGCRYWVTKVLELLHERGLIGSYSDVTDALPKAWGSGRQLPHGKNVEQGTFH